MDGQWSEVEIGGKKADVYEPGKANPFGFTVVYLHGVHEARLTENEAYGREFDRHGLRVLAPRCGPSWWVDKVYRPFDEKLTPERYVRETVLGWLAETYGTTPPRVGLFGTSMGGQGALRMAFKYPHLFPVTAAVAPAIDYQHRYYEYEPLQQLYPEPEAVRQDTATLHVHPLNWCRNLWFSCDPADEDWHESADRLQMKLSSLGIPHECDLETTGGGHGWEYYNRMAPTVVGFLAERLAAERGRLPIA